MNRSGPFATGSTGENHNTRMVGRALASVHAYLFVLERDGFRDTYQMKSLVSSRRREGRVSGSTLYFRKY